MSSKNKTRKNRKTKSNNTTRKYWIPKVEAEIIPFVIDGVYIKDKNNKDCDTIGANNSLGKTNPTNKLFEKSGAGNIKKPPIKPKIIETYAVFSFIFLL